MEQSPQVTSDTPEAAPEPVMPEQASGDEVLREELAKWRERVPKLAGALRQRAEEAEALKQELERLRRARNAEADVSAGIRARDELIEELEAKLGGLSERHRSAQAELHKRQLEADDLRHESSAWKSKWQTVTRSLDAQAAEQDQHQAQSLALEQANEDLRRRLAEITSAHGAGQRLLEEAVEERDSLRRRNEQLFETTELANRQIGSLTDSLTELRASLKQQREREGAAVAERDALREQLENLERRYAELEANAQRQAEAGRSAETRARDAEQAAADLEARLHPALQAMQDAEQAVMLLTGELHLVSVAAAAAFRAAADSSAETSARTAEVERARQTAEQRLAELEQARSGLQASLDEQSREVSRLTGIVEVANRTTAEREDERRALSERLQALEAKNEHLEQQLVERSALVVTLEQDQIEATRRREALEQERDELEEARIRAERHVKEGAEHITALDDKLERQKELMESLEQELAEAREELAQSAKARQADAAGAESEVARLHEQVRKLEGIVRERTDALNRLEWRRQLSGGEADDRADTEAPADGEDTGGKLLLVLNQQLDDARAKNDELLGRVRRLEEQLASAGSSGERHGDDLTRIHGVGQKLAEQLYDLGISRYEQIAELDEDELADESHVLHAHRGRILRDGWIDQAVKLIRH